MGAYPVLRRFTPEEYLRLERASATRNEYIDGQIYAMAGGTMEHDTIVKNIDRALAPQLEGGPCDTWTGNFRIAVSKSGPYYYPDLSVICGEPELLDRSRDCALNPVAVFEVSSKSTRKFDRDTKVVRYQEISTIRHIVLISQYSVAVEHHFRRPRGKWRVEKLTGLSSTLALPPIGATLPLTVIYNKLALHSRA